MGSSPMLPAIRMCLRPKMDNGNNTTWPLVSLGFASGTNFTSGIIPLLYYKYIYLLCYSTKVIIPEVKLVPEAKPRDNNNRGVLSALATIGPKHILMARSIAEGPNF